MSGQYKGRDSLYSPIHRRVFLMQCGSTAVILPAKWLHREAFRLGLPYGNHVTMIEIKEHLDGTLTLRVIKETQEEQ